jgi:acetyl-CoA carboxylase biotin carboxyl carrier protein
MDLNEVKELMSHMRAHRIESLELELEGVRLKMVHQPASACISQEPVEILPVLTATAAGQPASEETIEVRSPVVGIYYEAPAPEAEPFVQPGDRVEAGQTLCIVEAMKLLNEVAAPCAGHIAAVLCNNGTGVEYGEVLFHILPLESE